MRNTEPTRPRSRLRIDAEEELSRKPCTEGNQYSAEHALHELQVYQVELEMQNELLRQTVEDLEASRDSFSILYQEAPVGYVNLTSDGSIADANLTAHNLLGAENDGVRGMRFVDLVAPEDRDRCQTLVTSSA